MMVKRTTGWVAFAVAYLALSAVAEPTRRVKGLHRQAQQQRRLDTESKYKQPGILRAFGGVWEDVAYERAPLVTKCVKRKKAKKATDFAGGSGKAGGKGGGKGSNKRQGAGTDAADAAASSNSTTAADAAVSADSTADAQQALASKSSKETKKNEKFAPNGLPYCDEAGDAVADGPPAVAPTSPDAPKSSEDSGDTAPSPDAPTSSGDSGGTAPSVPESPTAPVSTPTATAPVGSPVSSPTSPTAPDGSNPGDSGGSSPTPIPGTSPIAGIPTSTPVTVPTPTTPTTGDFVGQEAVCEAFFDGTAPTDAPRQDYKMDLSLNVESGTNEEDVLTTMGEILNTEVAPSLLGCTQRRKSRRIQTTNSEYVNLVFSEPRRNADGTCTNSDGDCIPVISESSLYFYGDEPQDFSEILRQSMLFWDWSNIPGFQGFADVLVTLEESDTDNGDNGTEGTSSPISSAPQTAAPVSSPTDRGIPAAEIQEEDNKSTNGVNPGAPVAAAVAALILILVAMFVVRSRKAEGSIASSLKHRELIEYEEDHVTDLGMETDSNQGTPVRKSYVVGDESVGSWGTGPPAEGQEVYAASLRNENENNYTYDKAIDYFPHGPHHECSSPNCITCETRRQAGTRFVVADTGVSIRQLQVDGPRDYETGNTVEL